MAACVDSRKSCAEPRRMLAVSDSSRGPARIGWLALLLMAGFASTAPPLNQQTMVYVDRHPIQVTPEADVQPTAATLVRGESSCASAGGEVLVRNCLTKLVSRPSSTDSILANCNRQADKLGCTTARDDELVSVRAIYDVTVSGQPKNECVIARIRLTSQRERYVDMASLLFRPGLGRLGACYTTPSVRIRILRPTFRGELAAGNDERLRIAAR